MANRQIFPSSLFPLRGDVSAEAGATAVRVIALVGIPIAGDITTILDQQTLVFNAATGQFEFESPANSSIQVNGVTLSDDYEFYVSGVSLACLVNWMYGFAHEAFVMGTPVNVGYS